MSLEHYIEEQIDQDLKVLSQQQEKEIQELKKNYDKRISQLQRQYTEEVEQEIQAQVNTYLFHKKQERQFTQARFRQEKLDTLYQRLVPEILETSFGQQQLQDFLHQASSSTSITVTGQYTETLGNLIQDQGYKVTLTPSSDLGQAFYQTAESTIELHISDLITQAQEMTLPELIDHLSYES